MTATATGVAAREMLHALADAGVSLVTGVPCSLLKGAFALLAEPEDDERIRGLNYLPAPREDSALGVASGAVVAGRQAAVLMQNSGLGYCLNVITSFNLIYQVPVLLIVSWRGHGGTDAIEHQVIGRELTSLLDVFDLPHLVLDPDRPGPSTAAALQLQEQAQRCTALIVREPI